MIENRQVKNLIDIINRRAQYNRHSCKNKHLQNMRIAFSSSGPVPFQLFFNDALVQPENKNEKQKPGNSPGNCSDGTAGRAICRSQQFLSCLLTRFDTDSEENTCPYNADYRVDQLFDNLGNCGRNHCIQSLEITSQDCHNRHNKKAWRQNFQSIYTQR